VLLGGLATITSVAARAGLGEDVASVEVDRQQIRASVQRTNHAAFSVHELATENKGIVREYVSPSGQVFAVTWHGPFVPNLRQLLGVHFDVAANSPHRQSGGRGHLAVTEVNLVFESNGRMRSFHGRAYLSNAIPAGVDINDIE